MGSKSRHATCEKTFLSCNKLRHCSSESLTTCTCVRDGRSLCQTTSRYNRWAKSKEKSLARSKNTRVASSPLVGASVPVVAAARRAADRPANRSSANWSVIPAAISVAPAALLSVLPAVTDSYRPARWDHREGSMQLNKPCDASSTRQSTPHKKVRAGQASKNLWDFGEGKKTKKNEQKNRNNPNLQFLEKLYMRGCQSNDLMHRSNYFFQRFRHMTCKVCDPSTKDC